MHCQLKGITAGGCATSKLSKVWILILLSLAFSFADIVRLSPYEFDMTGFSEVRLAGLAVAMAALVVSAGLSFIRTDHRITALITGWLLLSFLLLISALLKDTTAEALNCVWYVLGVPLLCFGVIPHLLRHAGEEILAWAVILGDLPLLGYSLANYPVRFPFMGATGNPNSLGVVAATVACAFLILLNRANARLTFARVLIPLVGFLASATITLASGSRTSAFTLAAVTVCCAAELFSLASKRLRFRIAVGVGVAVILGISILAANADFATAAVGIFAKSGEGRSTFLPERDQIWLQTVADASILGHGKDYFMDRFFLGAHNSIMQVFGQYGVLAACGLVLFGISALISAWRYYRRWRTLKPFALLPLMFQLCFWGLSIGEGMFGMIAGSINLAFLISVGITQTAPGFARGRVRESAPRGTELAQLLRGQYKGLAPGIR